MFWHLERTNLHQSEIFFIHKDFYSLFSRKFQYNYCCEVKKMKLQKILDDYKKLAEIDRDATPFQKEAKVKEVHDQLVADGQKAFRLLKDAYGDGAQYFACLLARMVVDLDNHTTDEEYQLFVDATGIQMSKHEFDNLTKNGRDDAFVNELNDVIDNSTPSGKEAALRFVAIFMVGDKELTDEELALFKVLED